MRFRARLWWILAIAAALAGHAAATETGPCCANDASHCCLSTTLQPGCAACVPVALPAANPQSAFSSRAQHRTWFQLPALREGARHVIWRLPLQANSV